MGHRDFARHLWQGSPLGSGPIAVSDYKAGKTGHPLTRNPDYWGKISLFAKAPIICDEIKLDF